VNWCWEGPAWAHVENVFITEGAIQNLSSFETAY
jgi:hypothetical protein